MSSFKKNIISVYSVNIVNGILGIIFVPLSLKFFGVEGYGLFSIYGVLASFVSLIDLGVGKNLQRLLASENKKEVQQRHLKNALGIYLVLSVILVALLPVLLIIIPAYVFPVPLDNLYHLRLIIIFSIVEYILIIPISMTQNFCFANERFDRYARFTFISGITRYALLFFGIFVFASPSIVVGLVVCRRLFDIYTARRIMGALPNAVWRPQLSLNELKSVVRHSTALSSGQVIQSIVISAGTLLVNKYFGLEGMGKYRAAFDLSSKVWFFSNGIGLVIFPKFVRQLNSIINDGYFLGRIYRVINISWIIFSLISAMGILMASFVLDLMHINNQMILDLFVILLVGICLNAHANLSYELLQASAKYKVINLLGILSLTIMVVVFYLMKDAFGIYSIGWAWLISQSVYAVVSDILALKTISVPRNLQLLMIILKMLALLCSVAMIATHFELISKEFRFYPVIILMIFFVVAAKVNIGNIFNRSNLSV